jgi:hypothetical protein
MRLLSFVWLLLALACCFPRQLFAQTNLIQNGGFEQFTPQDNLWDGVDNEGFLAGWRRSLPAVTEKGGVGNLPMPLSVNFVDINGDGLPDLVTADPTGYFRAYFNSGTKTEPKFTHCEMIPLFLSHPTQPGARAFNDVDGIARLGTKLNLFPWSKRGVLDLIVGDYAGEILFIPNFGNAAVPDWRQPRLIDDALVRTARNGQLWGNLFAPCVWDWDRDGRPDLLLGDGSYSANNVYVLLNKGGGAKPEFTEESRYILEYGDGRDQLVPTIADFNGDGQPDLLIGDRKGGVGFCINRGSWKPGAVLEPPVFVPLGRTGLTNECFAPFAADWNGDGLFDLIIGKVNGRIAVAINRGTKTQPKFDPPFEVRGVDVWKHGTVAAPNAWSVEAGTMKGNIGGYFTIVDAASDKDAAPAEGAHCLKAGYFAPLNKVFRKQPLDIPATEQTRDLFDVVFGQIRPFTAERAARQTPVSTFIAHSIFKTQLKVGATYILSFKVKGANVRDAHWTLGYAGSKDHKSEAEMEYENGGFAPGSQWAVVTKTFSVRFKNAALRDLPTTTAALLELKFTLMPYDGVIYIDDVQLVEKG